MNVRALVEVNSLCWDKMSSQPLTLCQDVVPCSSELLEKSQSIGIGLNE